MLMENSLVAENVIRGRFPSGSAIYSEWGTLGMRNSTVTGNDNVSAPIRAAIQLSSTSYVSSSIIWGNLGNGVPNMRQVTNYSGGATIDYSDVGNGWTGLGSHNIQADPGFVHETGRLEAVLGRFAAHGVGRAPVELFAHDGVELVARLGVARGQAAQEVRGVERAGFFHRVSGSGERRASPGLSAGHPRGVGRRPHRDRGTVDRG